MKKGVILICILCFLTAVFPQSRTKEIEKSFPADPGTNLFMKADGDVDITTWNKREIYVKITLRGSEKYRDRYEFDLDKRGQTVRVITTKHGCFPEAGGPSSMYIDPNNIEELAEAIKKVTEDSGLKQKMIDDGYNYARKFDDEIVAKNIMNAYQNILQSG